MAFPSTDNALCPTKEALIQALGLWGPVWPSAAPQTPETAPEPPHHNLLRCQEEHLCDSGEETLLKFSH
ncbi:hypothetical protein CesoFtcFv8_019929 [Champsocephalus esox]|uniref:Uncharacterized protein n=2 Tax=Champsocephalus TaxID=52236 RepID=A0AAN8D156_CHAGU|nr:hypothetical protein CesoFtcFv8_019929 [Champsocephalus esox]KAK5911218.1 hypothetical protein CgunFtcFv8_005413 [Champsocephalus gunnari]